MQTRRLVIVGSGLAGYSLAREIRKLSSDIELTMISRDDGCYYSKPMLSSAYTSGKAPADIPLNTAASMADQLHAKILPQTAVRAIDLAARHVITDGGAIDYDKLVLAIGADPIRVPIAGPAQDQVMSINDLQDYTRFRAVADRARHVVIMGAGLIGCEFANDLTSAGISVAVADPAAYPLSRFVPEAIGRALERTLGAAGAQWRMGQTVRAVEHDGGRYSVEFSNGDRCVTDVVVSSIGLRPRTQLAAAAGLQVGRGIQVDRWLRTSADTIYALGDCAEVCGHVLPFVMPIMHASRALAQTLTGTPTTLSYPAMPVVVKTTRYPIVVAPPAADAKGEWEIAESADGINACYYAPDRALLGFALSGTATAQKNALSKALPPILA